LKRGAKRSSITEYRDALNKRHGPEFTDDLDAVFDGYNKLAHMSKRYGISKSRLSQIFKRVFGKPFRVAKKLGAVKDQDGTIYSFDDPRSKNFMVKLPAPLHEKLRRHSDSLGLSMSVVVRDCIADLFMNDGLGQLSKLF